MLEYNFYANANPSMMEHVSEIDFLYHINTCDWPITHGHKDYWEFTIVTKGSMRNRCNSKETIHGANSMFVSTTHDVHRLLAVNNKPLRYINIMVKEEYLLRMLSTISPTFIQHLSSKEFSLTLPDNTINEIEQILLRVNYYNAEQDYKENNELLCSAFLLIVSAILLDYATDSLQVPTHFITLNQLAQSNDLLICNVNDLCRKMNLSRIQLNHLFKRCYGVTPHDYLIKYKFIHACKLLANTNMTVVAISDAIGYSNTTQFHTTFKKLFGMTPAQYRKGVQTTY